MGMSAASIVIVYVPPLASIDLIAVLSAFVKAIKAGQLPASCIIIVIFDH
jgi:hypothetical protein